MKNLLTNYYLRLGEEVRKESIKAIFDFLDDIDPEASYLDCGCGDGELTLELAKKIGTKRMLKPNGYLVVSTPNLASWHNVFALLLGMQPSAGPDVSKQFSIGFHPLYEEHKKTHPKQGIEEVKEHIKILTYRSLRKLFLSYGFEIEKEAFCGYYPFSGRVARFFSKEDNWHTVNVALRLKICQ